ncbi:hypothetical protein U1Q18_025709 [Sarracenia purpurea var. burkii]
MVSQDISYTLDEALNTIRFGKCRGLVLADVGVGWIAEAMEVMLLPFVGPAVKSEWGLSPSEEIFQAALAWIVMPGLGRKWLVALSPLPEDWNEEILLSEDIHLLTRGPKKIKDSETRSSSMLALFSPKLIRTTFLLWSVLFGSTFSYYGIVLPTSQLSSEERVAI